MTNQDFIDTGIEIQNDMQVFIDEAGIDPEVPPTKDQEGARQLKAKIKSWIDALIQI